MAKIPSMDGKHQNPESTKYLLKRMKVEIMHATERPVLTLTAIF
jgi:hypothetical protein